MSRSPMFRRVWACLGVMGFLTIPALPASAASLTLQANSLGGVFYIAGDIPNPMPIDVEIAVDDVLPPLGEGAAVWAINLAVYTNGPGYPGFPYYSWYSFFTGFNNAGSGFPPTIIEGSPGGLLVSDDARQLNIYIQNETLNAVSTFSQATIYLPDGLTITPLPAALPLFATGFGALGLLGWRRKRKTSAVVAMSKNV